MAGLLMKIGVGEEVPETPGSLSAEGKDFLNKCFVKDPRNRWTAEMLLNHPFIIQEFEDYDIVALRDGQENTTSTSPRCPFDFPEWVSSVTSSITSLPSPEYTPESSSWLSGESSLISGSGSIAATERLSELVTGLSPDWPVSDDWVTIR
ncbi:Mitogen-activated protein kinase kinase kinase [Handroanthus impetiginosus]|uniref:Mitogen-activated protein kinase kinase kinase n=1 Tax=Handroanthus impetiginosus TaxID=429701 RepID=A0A2G9I648_9LAMI|nr:Mitogen-activated protein kinase kinase kinase [Handroanthus impetiginosus]